MNIAKHGIKLTDYKELSLSTPKAQKVLLPSRVRISLKQHEGLSSLGVVHEGDHVFTGTLIGAAQGDFSANVHASVSGKVARVSSEFVEIESDGTDTWDPSVEERKHWQNASQNEILLAIRLAGIVSPGEAVLPLDLKLRDCLHAGDWLILNGCESEPFLTSDYLLMLNHPTEVLRGVEFLLKAAGKEICILAIQDNKLDAIELLLSKIRALQISNIEVRKLPSCYPQDFEPLLSRNLLGFKTVNGLMPLVEKVSTAYAVYEAVRFGKPFVERTITVTGHCVAEPKNLIGRIGMSVLDLIRNCKGLLRDPHCVLLGGPMAGASVADLETPVMKSTHGIVALAKEYVHQGSEQSCTRCGLCVEACPERLVPEILMRGIRKREKSVLREFALTECIDCGNCTYVCPSKIPLAELLRKGKIFLRSGSETAGKVAEEEASLEL